MCATRTFNHNKSVQVLLTKYIIYNNYTVFLKFISRVALNQSVLVLQVESRRRVKEPIRTQRAALCLQCVQKTDTIHKGGLDCRWEQFCSPCICINDLQGREIHPCGLTASVKSRL